MDAKPHRERMLITVAILCIAAFVGDRFVLSPLANVWTARSARIVVLQDDTAKGAGLLAREETLRARWDDMQMRSLASNESIAESDVLTAVSRWTNTSRLVVTSLRPRWLDGGDDHKLLEIRATGQGDMESIARFLYELESDALAVRLQEIEMKEGSGDVLTLTVRFSGLMLLGENNES